MTYLLVEDAASRLATAIRPYIRKKKQFRSTMKDLLNDTFSRSLYANSIYNGQPDPAGGIAAGWNADGSPVPTATQPEGTTRVSETQREQQVAGSRSVSISPAKAAVGVR